MAPDPLPDLDPAELRLPGHEPRFLINPYGLFFEEINASSLVAVDAQGNVLADTPQRVNQAGFIVAHLGDRLALMFGNHGTLTVGRTVGEAFQRMYVLEKACQIQVAAQCGDPLVIPTPESIAAVYPQLESFGDVAGLTWKALLRRLERTEPDFRD